MLHSPSPFFLRSDWSTRHSGEWYLDPDYEPLAWAGTMAPYVSAAQEITWSAAQETHVF